MRGGAIYNWGYCKGLNATSKRITELEEINQKHKQKIKELYEYISKSYCLNPFGIKQTNRRKNK